MVNSLKEELMPNGKEDSPEQSTIFLIREIIRGIVGKSLQPKLHIGIKKNIEEYSYRLQIIACETPNDFRALFSLYNVPKEEWRNAKWLQNNKLYGLYKAISRRFDNSWETFLEFMGPAPKLLINQELLKRSFVEQVNTCETSEDFHALFKLHCIEGEEWRIKQVFLDKKPGLCVAILNRFEHNWGRFKVFMGTESVVIDDNLLKRSYSEQIKVCKTPDDFRTLFRLHGVQKEKWRVAINIRDVMYRAILDRFSQWSLFLEFMGPEALPPIDINLLERPQIFQVTVCENSEDFRILFKLHGIEGEEWRSARWLQNHQLQGLYVGIRRRFDNNWQAFLEFMGPAPKLLIDQELLERPYTEQIAACKTYDDFLTLFNLHEIPDDCWKNTTWLARNNFIGLYEAIHTYFSGNWQNFLEFMEGTDQKIESLDIDDAIALLGNDPVKLKLYIKVSHPELTDEEVDRLVIHAFRGLTIKKDYDYSDFEEKLESCVITAALPENTDEKTITIQGRAPGADSVMIFGRWNRRVRTAQDGSFTARIILEIGAQNSIDLLPLNHEKKQCASATTVIIEQTSEHDDIGGLIELLSIMGKQALADIQRNPGRLEYLTRSTEQVLIKKFVRSFEEGRNYVETIMCEIQSSPVKKILKKVLDNFRRIDRTNYPNIKKDSPLYFFQKYCVAQIQQKMDEGARGVILANAPGLGKTRTALVAVNGDRAVIVAPNSVVSGWGEEAEKCLKDADVLTLQNIPHKERIELLQKSHASHVVTNIEFLRAENDQDNRYKLLSDDETIVVHDEAHSLANLGSEQSKGARRLNGKFHLYLTATPFKNPRMMRRMFHNLYPTDKRFSSDKAFAEAFPATNPTSLRTLSVLKDKHVIRFRKEDVLEEMDPSIPIEEQKDRLLRKEFVPPEKMGEFTMSNEQASAIFDLMLNWPEWCEFYDKYVPKDDIAKMDHLRGNQFTLAKQHALRQTVNNPAYIGIKDGEDAKAKEMERAVKSCLREGRKVVIFCQYNSQALKYAELFKKQKPCLYTGFTSDEGLKANDSGKPIRFRKHENGGWEFDERGYPIEDVEGVPMLAMDYERLTFQNSSDRKIMISTYSAGAVGVTFTAGKAVIEDDQPRDCIEEIQAEDRTHRIDHEHQTHHSVKYIKMISKYPEEFLDITKRIWIEKNDDGTYEQVLDESYALENDLETAYDKFFSQGTFDEVKLKNLATQRKMFHLINDGIAEESLLKDDQIIFKGLED